MPRVGGKKGWLEKKELVAGNDGPKDQRHLAETSEHSSPPHQPAEPSGGSVLSKGHTAPGAATLESGAQRESEKRTKELLAAYQGTLDVVEELPAVVWLRRGEKGLGRFLKVPYLRWFLRYFLTHHIQKSLSTLNRRFHAIAALARPRRQQGEARSREAISAIAPANAV